MHKHNILDFIKQKDKLKIFFKTSKSSFEKNKKAITVKLLLFQTLFYGSITII